MTYVRDPRDRRFRRSLVKPGRKRTIWRGSLMRSLGYGVSALLVGYGSYRGTPMVASAAPLRIDRIEVSGNARLSTGEVLGVLEGLHGGSIVWADLEKWRQRLQTVPWVQDAGFRRYLPSTIEVHITERNPMAIARINGELYLVDGGGMLIDAYGPQYADFDLPIVDGLAAPAGDGTETLSPERADLAARVIAALQEDPEVGKRVSQIDVSDPRNASVILTGDPAVIYVGRERFLQRLQSYLQLGDTLRGRVAGIDYVDLRFENWVYVGPMTKNVRDAGASSVADVGGGNGSGRR